MRPRMIVVAGPPGSGKSTAFPVAASEVDHLNVDDLAARMNHGSYRNIPTEIRAEANRRCEAFIEEHIREKKSFAVEATLRAEITFEQARAARANGFAVHMTFVATDDVEANIERVAMRADRGGHSASAARIRKTYEASLKHFPRALRELDEVTAFDNSALAQNPRLVLVAERGRITYVAQEPPSWLQKSLTGTEYATRRPGPREADTTPSTGEPERND